MFLLFSSQSDWCKVFLCSTSSLTIAVALIIQPPPAPPITSMSPDLEMRIEGTIAEGGLSPRAKAESIIPPVLGHTDSFLPAVHSSWRTNLIPHKAQVFQTSRLLVLRPHLTRNWPFTVEAKQEGQSAMQIIKTCCRSFNPDKDQLAAILPLECWCPLSLQTQGSLHQEQLISQTHVKWLLYFFSSLLLH